MGLSDGNYEVIAAINPQIVWEDGASQVSTGPGGSVALRQSPRVRLLSLRLGR
jgi:hypothetical protein